MREAVPCAGFALIDDFGALATSLDAEFLDSLARDIYDGRLTAVVAMPTAEDFARFTEAAAERDADNRAMTATAPLPARR